jgi:hypothetical protein
MKIFDFVRKYMGKMVGAGAEIFDKLEPEPHKNGPAPQHWVTPDLFSVLPFHSASFSSFASKGS